MKRQKLERRKVSYNGGSPQNRAGSCRVTGRDRQGTERRGGSAGGKTVTPVSLHIGAGTRHGPYSLILSYAGLLLLCRGSVTERFPLTINYFLVSLMFACNNRQLCYFRIKTSVFLLFYFIYAATMTTKMRRCALWMAIISLVVFIVFNFISWYYINLDKTFQTYLCKINQTDYSKKVKLDKNVESPSPVQPVTGVWTIKPRGRMGNLMGEYAALYALSKINGHQPYILPHMHEELSQLFRIKLPVLPQEVANRMKWKRYMLLNWMLPEYRNISGEYVQFYSTPWSWTFYHHIKDEIFREFTFHDYLKEGANKYLAKIRGDRKNVTFIGVHVRRGDYVEYMPKVRKGVVAHKGYMDKAMAYYRNKYSNPLFVVVSNGMDWCKENINSSFGDVHFAEDGDESSPARDFTLLVHCNHTIMTIGSFGIWASYMAGGETIYLSNYIMPNSPFLKQFRYDTAYRPEWIGIPADLSPLMGGKGKAKL